MARKAQVNPDLVGAAGFELDVEQARRLVRLERVVVRDALPTALDDREPVVFLTGRAGTGKSHFIRTLLKEDQHRPQVVLAPTGLAAMNIGGQTVQDRKSVV